MKHKFNDPKADGPDSTIVRPSNWNEPHIISWSLVSSSLPLDSPYDGILASNTITLTLPAISSVPSGQTFIIKNMGTGVITITPSGADTVDGSLGGYTLENQYQCVVVSSDGSSDWVVVEGKAPSFADGETPTGTIDGTNKVFTLIHTPNPSASLELVSRGIVRTLGGVDFTLVGNQITYVEGAQPQIGDTHICWYRH